MTETLLQTAIRTLRFGAHQKDWSVNISSAECEAVLGELERGERTLTYLAVPYSHPDRQVRVARFEAANAAAGLLMKRGGMVFSPISHTHPIAEACDLPKGWDFWQGFDRAYLSASRQLTVLCIEGWRESTGVRAEIGIAVEFGIPIEFIRVAGGEIVMDAFVEAKDVDTLLALVELQVARREAGD